MKEKIKEKAHHAIHASQHFFHCMYLAAVSYEAHGVYAQAALVLLVVVVVGMVTGDAEA